MENLSARNGLFWAKQGLILFCQQPVEILMLFLSYMFIMMTLSVIPVIGQFLSLILIPMFTMSFMQASLNIKQGKRVYPNLLLIGFRLATLQTLLVLGLFYLLAAFITIAVSMLIDGGVLWQIMTNFSINIIDIENKNIRIAIIISGMLYIPAAMAFWFAAPLIVWKNMTLGKALFYSFFAVYRASKAFIMYSFIWLIASVLIPAIISAIIALFIKNVVVVAFIFLPLSIFFTAIMYCSFYVTYATIFDKN